MAVRKRQQPAGSSQRARAGLRLLAIAFWLFAFSRCALPGMLPCPDYAEIPAPGTLSEEGDSETETAAEPAGPLELTTQEAILLALQNNRALRVERFSPAIRNTSEQQERAVFDSTLSSSASGSRDRAGTSKSTSAGGELGLSKQFPTGSTLGADISSSRSWSSSSGASFTTRAGINFTQALLKGADTGANLAGIRQARLDTLSSEFELRGFAESLVAQVETTYWDYVLARRRIEIFEGSLQLARTQLSETEERIKVGKLAQIELAAAKALVAQRREELINARSTLEKTRLHLLRLLNPPGPDRWDRKVTLKDLPAVPEVEVGPLAQHVELALKKRPDLNQARLAFKRGELEVVKTKDGLLPRLDLFITLGRSGYARSFHSSIGDLDGESYNMSAVLTLEYPLGKRSAKASHKRAVLSLNQAQESLANLADLVQEDMRSAFVELERTKEQIAATAVTLKLREETLRAETEKFRLGRSTSFLVAQAQRDLVQSQVSQVEASVSYLKSLVELFRLEGTLLERRGIAAPGAVNKQR